MSLRVKRWGNVSDGTTFTKRFEPGQVLFGKRRVYQKKADDLDVNPKILLDLMMDRVSYWQKWRYALKWFWAQYGGQPNIAYWHPSVKERKAALAELGKRV